MPPLAPLSLPDPSSPMLGGVGNRDKDPPVKKFSFIMGKHGRTADENTPPATMPQQLPSRSLPLLGKCGAGGSGSALVCGNGTDPDEFVVDKEGEKEVTEWQSKIHRIANELVAGVARGIRIPALITNPDGSYRKQKPWSDEWILERAKIRAMIQLQTESDSDLKHVKGDETLRKTTIFNEVDVTRGKTLGERGAGAEKRGAVKRGIRWCVVIDDGGEGGSNKKRAVESSLAVMTNGLQQGDEQHVAGSKMRLATKPSSGRADPDPATRNASGVDHGNVGGSTHLRSTSPSQDACPSSTPSPNISGEFGSWQSDLPAPPPQPPVRARHHAAHPGHDENTYMITREWHEAAQEGGCPFEKRGVVAPARPSKEARVLAGPQQPLTVRNGAAAAAANRGGGGKGGAGRREESVGIESVTSCDGESTRRKRSRDSAGGPGILLESGGGGGVFGGGGGDNDDDELGLKRSAGRCSSMMVAPDVEVLPPREARSSTPGGQSRGAVEWGAEESWRGRGLSHVEQRGLMGMSSATSEGGVRQALGLMEGDENHEMSWLDAAEDDPVGGGVRWAHARPRAVMRLPPPPEPDSTPPRAKAPSSRLF